MFYSWSEFTLWPLLRKKKSYQIYCIEPLYGRISFSQTLKILNANNSILSFHATALVSVLEILTLIIRTLKLKQRSAHIIKECISHHLILIAVTSIIQTHFLSFFCSRNQNSTVPHLTHLCSYIYSVLRLHHVGTLVWLATARVMWTSTTCSLVYTAAVMATLKVLV